MHPVFHSVLERSVGFGLQLHIGPICRRPAHFDGDNMVQNKRPPRKDFWDDLLIAMFERLWTENWRPKNKTEVENAMLDWAASHGKQLGPTSVKIPAGKLFKLTQH